MTTITRPIRRPRRSALALALAMVIAACGGSGGGPGTTTGSGVTQPPGGDTTTQPTTGATQPPPSGDLGSFTVDGQRFGVTNVIHTCGDLVIGSPTWLWVDAFAGLRVLRVDYMWLSDEDMFTGDREVMNIEFEDPENGELFGGGLYRRDSEDVWSDGVSPVPGFAVSIEGGRYRGGPVTVHDEDDFDNTRVVEWDFSVTPNPGAGEC